VRNVFIMVMTMIVGTLYWRLAQNRCGFEKCDANKTFQNFIHGSRVVAVNGDEIKVAYPKRARNPY
jgi:hypothetical protein